MSDQIIARVSQSLAKEQSLESLVRQLLEMLEMVTDMESTYLTKVDVEARLQHIMFARNSQKMHIPENFTVSWDYSLCKRAIDENCFFSDEVPDRWGDCIAARNLGITTFLSTPIHLPDGSFYGTLCAASSEKRQWSERAEQVLQLFAGLIAQYIQKEALVEQLREANAALIAQSYTDSLTGLPKLHVSVQGFFIARRNRNRAGRARRTIGIRYETAEEFRSGRKFHNERLCGGFLTATQFFS